MTFTEPDLTLPGLFSLPDSPAKTSPSQAVAAAWVKARARACTGRSTVSWLSSLPLGFSSKTSLDSCRPHAPAPETDAAATPTAPAKPTRSKGGACERQCIDRHGGVMGAVLGSLAERGYGFAYRVLDARYFGVPQRRRRVFIVGHLGGTGAAPAQVLLEPEGVQGDSAAGSEARQGVAITARERVAGGGRAVGFHLTQDPISGDEITPAMTAGNGQGCATIGVAVGVLGNQSHTLTAEGFDASEDGSGRGTPIIAFDHLAGPTSSGYASTEVTQTILAGGGALRGAGAVMYAAEHVTALDTQQGGADDNSAQGGHLVAYPMAVRGRQGGADLEIGKPGDPMFALRAGDGGSSRSQLIATALTTRAGATFDDQQIGQLVVGDPQSINENQRGELNLTDTAALSTGGGKPGQGYPAITDGVTVRRLTPIECERLQGVPDDWTDVEDASDSQRYRQMGNSVAVPVLTWTFRRLIDVAERVA